VVPLAIHRPEWNPILLLSHETDLSEYFLVQALSKTTSVVLGKISDVFIDQTMIGDELQILFRQFQLQQKPDEPIFIILLHGRRSAMDTDEVACIDWRSRRSKQPVKQLRDERFR
jgi:hypothetical protein